MARDYKAFCYYLFLNKLTIKWHMKFFCDYICPIVIRLMPEKPTIKDIFNS